MARKGQKQEGMPCGEVRAVCGLQELTPSEVLLAVFHLGKLSMYKAVKKYNNCLQQHTLFVLE